MRAKKAPRKAHVPGGQRTQSPFRERLDAITLACGRTRRQFALGGSKRLPRVGECIVAEGGPPCQRQPLRGHCLPKRGADPSTWSVGRLGDRRGWPVDGVPRRQSQCFRRKPHDDLPRGPLIPSSWEREDTAGGPHGSRVIFRGQLGVLSVGNRRVVPLSPIRDGSRDQSCKRRYEHNDVTANADENADPMSPVAIAERTAVPDSSSQQCDES
jgi:hypothetical protein